MKGKEYIEELAGRVALPDCMNCSLMQFASRIKLYIDNEINKIAPDMALIALLCDAARLGWEQIEWAYREVDAPLKAESPANGSVSANLGTTNTASTPCYHNWEGFSTVDSKTGICCVCKQKCSTACE